MNKQTLNNVRLFVRKTVLVCFKELMGHMN